MNISRKSSLSTRRWSRSINNETFSGAGSTNPDRFENASFSPPPPKPRSDITPYSPLKSNNRRKKITLTPSPNEQSFQASIRPWIQSSEVNPAIPPPIPLAHSFARAHKHFFHLSVAQSLPCLPIRTKAFYFFFLFSIFRSLVIRSFVHSPAPVSPSASNIPARFPSIRGSSVRANPRNFEAEFYRRLAGAGGGGSPMA